MTETIRAMLLAMAATLHPQHRVAFCEPLSRTFVEARLQLDFFSCGYVKVRTLDWETKEWTERIW